MSSVFQRVLGPSFGELSPVLRRFHADAVGGSATGRLAVEYGKGRVARWIASCMRLPAESPREEVTLKVTVDDQQEIWVRHFGARRMRSVLRKWDRLLLEGVGPLVLGFELLVEDGGMQFVQRATWFLGVRLPLVIAPRASCKVTPTGEKWKLDVRLELPLIGPLVRYHGVMAPVEKEAPSLKHQIANKS